MLAGVAAVTSFLAVLCVTLALTATRRRETPLEARVRGLSSIYPDQEPVVDLERPFLERVALPFLEGFGNLIVKLLPTTFVGRVRHLLTLAGHPFSVTGFLFLMAVSAVAVPALFLAFALLVGAGFSSVLLLAVVTLAALGFFIPYFWLARRVARRQHEILKSLPNAFDLISTCVEAGLGLYAAFAKVAEKLPGPFSEELQQALRETAMGRMRRDALRDVGQRTGVSEVITFVNAIIHADTTGSSIADVLRAQSDAIRTKRRQRIEQTAQRIPIYMTFPLVLFLLPSLFIVLLGPAGIQVWNSLVDK